MSKWSSLNITPAAPGPPSRMAMEIYIEDGKTFQRTLLRTDKEWVREIDKWIDARVIDGAHIKTIPEVIRVAIFLRSKLLYIKHCQ